MLELTENEKKVLIMLFRMCDEMLTACDGYIDMDCHTFGRSDLFYLSEKLGIDY